MLTLLSSQREGDNRDIPAKEEEVEVSISRKATFNVWSPRNFLVEQRMERMKRTVRIGVVVQVVDVETAVPDRVLRRHPHHLTGVHGQA
jgi:hypothetical protein